MISRTQRALILVRAGMIPYQAAAEVGIKPATIYNALKRARIAAERARCPTCGSVLPKP